MAHPDTVLMDVLLALDTDLKFQEWQPSALERTVAALVLTADPDVPPADTYVSAVRMAGPGIAQTGSNHLASLLIPSADALRPSLGLASPAGERLRTGVAALLASVRKTPLDWAAGRQLVRDWVTEAKRQHQDGRWDVSDRDRVAAVVSGLTGEDAPLPRGWHATDPTGWAHCERLLAAVAPLREAALRPGLDGGPLPLLLTALADLCDDIRPEVESTRLRGATEISDDLFRRVSQADELLHRTGGLLHSVRQTAAA